MHSGACTRLSDALVVFSLLVTATELYRRLKWVVRGAAALPAPSTPKAASTVKNEAALDQGPGTKTGRGARSPESPKGIGGEIRALGPDQTRPRLAGKEREPSRRPRESIFSAGR